jgi:hypothetical protein
MDNNEDLDDEFKPTPIRIPKVNPKNTYDLLVNKTQVYESRGGRITVVLKKQEVEGYTIPHGTVIDIPYRHNGGSLTVPVFGEDLNKLLRIIYFDTLRTIKKK